MFAAESDPVQIMRVIVQVRGADCRNAGFEETRGVGPGVQEETSFTRGKTECGCGRWWKMNKFSSDLLLFSQ